MDNKYLFDKMRPPRSTAYGLTNHIHFKKCGIFLLLPLCTIRVHSKRNEIIAGMEKDGALNDFVTRNYSIFGCSVSVCFGNNDCNHEISRVSMRAVFALLSILFLETGFAACSTVPEPMRSEYAAGMFEAFVSQSYGKSTIAFYQFDVAREKAKKAGENPLKIIAIESLFYWYRTYASSLNLYNKRPTGDDRIRGEYRPANTNTPLARSVYESEWGNNPEQARLVREFMWGVGEVVAGVFCVAVGNVVFGTIGFGAGVDGVNRIFSSLNSLWTNHLAELQALKMWEQMALKPAINN